MVMIAKKSKMKKSTRQVYVLGWNGMEKSKIEINNVPKDKVEVSDWFHANLEGELCINTKGRIDQLKKITWVGGAGVFNGIFRPHKNYHFVHDKNIGFNAFLVGIRRGKTLKRWGKTFTYAKHSFKTVVYEGRKD